MFYPSTLSTFMFYEKYSQTHTSAKYMLQDPAVGNSFPESQENFEAGV